jgi:hypothetical protein
MTPQLAIVMPWDARHHGGICRDPRLDGKFLYMGPSDLEVEIPPGYPATIELARPYTETIDGLVYTFCVLHTFWLRIFCRKWRRVLRKKMYHHIWYSPYNLRIKKILN